MKDRRTIHQERVNSLFQVPNKTVNTFLPSYGLLGTSRSFISHDTVITIEIANKSVFQVNFKFSFRRVPGIGLVACFTV